MYHCPICFDKGMDKAWNAPIAPDMLLLPPNGILKNMYEDLLTPATRSTTDDYPGKEIDVAARKVLLEGVSKR